MEELVLPEFDILSTPVGVDDGHQLSRTLTLKYNRQTYLSQFILSWYIVSVVCRLSDWNTVGMSWGFGWSCTSVALCRSSDRYHLSSGKMAGKRRRTLWTSELYEHICGLGSFSCQASQQLPETPKTQNSSCLSMVFPQYHHTTYSSTWLHMKS